MKEREEIKRLLAAAGEPPTPREHLARAVSARIERVNPRAKLTRWSWLPRGWEIACVVASAFALGVITAEWRVRRGDARSASGQLHYLSLIDPTLPLPGKARP
jgi:hypothetical protein